MKRREALITLFKGSGALIAVPLLFNLDVLANSKSAAKGISNLYWEIETSGVLTRIKKDRISVQLRYAIYRDVTHPDYEKGLVDEVEQIEIGKEYSEIFKKEIPVYEAKKTGKKINPPAHNHIISLPCDMVNKQSINLIGNQILVEYIKSGNNMFIENQYIKDHREVTEDELIETIGKVNSIKKNTLWQ